MLAIQVLCKYMWTKVLKCFGKVYFYYLKKFFRIRWISGSGLEIGIRMPADKNGPQKK